jgi:hypothetical protein
VNLHSCANCWHNALQYDSVGLRLGYCTRHQVVLRQADHSTCGQQRRKDLLYASAARASAHQCEAFPAYEVVRVDGQQLNGTAGAYVSKDRSLFTDQVAATVAEYRLQPRIATFAQLRRTTGGRAELALVSLGRAYVDNCMAFDGKWTSGVNIMWWVKERCVREPEPNLRYDQDIRYELPVSPERQLELAKWSLLMLRLIFLSDMGRHATNSSQQSDGTQVIRETSQAVQQLESLADDAADAAGTELTPLQGWIQDIGLKRIDAALPKENYEAIQQELHKDPG